MFRTLQTERKHSQKVNINNEANIDKKNKNKLKVKVLYPIIEEDSAIKIIEIRNEYKQIIKKAAKSIKYLKLD